MARLNIRVKDTAQLTTFFSREELLKVAASLEVVLDPGDEIVHFGQNPPADTGKRWQQSDGSGAHVGKIKTYQGGEWT